MKKYFNIDTQKIESTSDLLKQWNNFNDLERQEYENFNSFVRCCQTYEGGCLIEIKEELINNKTKNKIGKILYEILSKSNSDKILDVSFENNGVKIWIGEEKFKINIEEDI